MCPSWKCQSTVICKRFSRFLSMICLSPILAWIQNVLIIEKETLSLFFLTQLYIRTFSLLMFGNSGLKREEGKGAPSSGLTLAALLRPIGKMKCLLNISPPALFGLRAASSAASQQTEERTHRTYSIRFPQIDRWMGLWMLCFDMESKWDSPVRQEKIRGADDKHVQEQQFVT